MALTTNTDGSVTYSITVPAALTVTHDTASAFYAAGGTQVADGMNQRDAWKQQIAGCIAIYDQMQLDAGAARLAARDALAAALYAADGATAGPWSGLTATAQAPYQTKADSLGSLGVSAASA